MEYTYYVLTSNTNNGTIVRANGREQFRYYKGKGWIDSSIMMEYFCEFSPLYDMYDEITEVEALKRIEEIENI